MPRDPVCGMHIEPGKAATEVEYGGRKFLFCSEGCKERFLEQPAVFVARDAEEHRGRGSA